MEHFMQTAEKFTDLIVNTQNYIWTHPETGYKEWNTSAYLAEIFENLGYNLTKPSDIPGFYTVLDTGRPGPEVLILGELDCLVCPDHPDADKATGNVHCCGHSAQCAALVGIAATLKEPGVLDSLSGRIRLCAVPAEELIEIEYRAALKEQGTITYYGGKPEFLHRGYFDGVDLAFMVHATNGPAMAVTGGNVGCLAKRVTYRGVSAHAGGCPWDGCNALYAANLGLSAINAIRETFQEKDRIRVHPIITKGGSAVNAIPDQVCLESFVRGSNFDGIREANRRVNRALIGGALSLGANIEIYDDPGYGPLKNDPGMKRIAEEAARMLKDIPVYVGDDISSGSTDMGDLGGIMPVIHPYMPGATGTSHGADYKIADPVLACVGSAKWQLGMLYLLLSEDAKRAKEILAEFKPQFATKEDYFAYLDTLTSSGERISYADGAAVVQL